MSNKEEILALKKHISERIDGYMTHLANGGKVDPSEEEYIDELQAELEMLQEEEWKEKY